MNRTRMLVAALVSVLLSGLIAPPAQSAGVWLNANASWTNPDAKAPKAVDLRYGHHQRFDRVVIVFRGAQVPGGMAHYQRTFTYDPSGLPVPIRGTSGLQVALTPAFGHGSQGNNLYTGPRIARPHFRTLKALAYTGDSEGVVTFAFALTYRAPYRIQTLTDPQRLVIDFRHRS